MPEGSLVASTADSLSPGSVAPGTSGSRATSPAAVLGVAFAFYALAFFAPFSSMDAALFLLAVAFLRQRLRPYLLLLAASVQDAPGLAYLWSYICFAGVGVLLLAESALRPPAGAGARFGPVERLVVMAIALIVYGAGVAWAQESLGGYPQSAERPFVAVAALTVVMILSGYFSRHVVDLDLANRRLLGKLAVLAIAHALAIGLLQIPFGQEIYRSGTNLAQVEATKQLMEAGVIGFARINGPFLSPNTFGYSILLLAVIAAVTLYETARWRVAFVYVIAGAAAVVLSMSKAVLGYYGLSGIVLSYFLIGGRRTALLAFACLLAVPLVLSSDLVQLALDVFRVQEGTLGTRSLAWSAAIDHMKLIDWLSGIGVGAWPPFFAQYIGEPLSDPHALLLSLPGSYGVLGVVFFVLLLATVFRVPIAGEDVVARRLGKSLLILLIVVKDLASIPSVLGNTPVTFLVWLLLGLVIASPPPARDGRA
jgi:hypothetical protein